MNADEITRLISESRMACDQATAITNDLHTERLGYHTEYLPLMDALQTIPTLCDLIESLQAQLTEVTQLALEITSKYETSVKTHKITTDLLSASQARERAAYAEANNAIYLATVRTI